MDYIKFMVFLIWTVYQVYEFLLGRVPPSLDLPIFNMSFCERKCMVLNYDVLFQ